MSFVVAVLAFVVAVNVGAVTVLHAAFPQVSLLPSSGKAPAKKAPAKAAVPVAARTGPLPAEQVVDAVVTGAVRTPAGWRASAVSSQITALSAELACTPSGKGPAPVVARSRGWVLKGGTVTVTARAYAAGAGAVAFADHKGDVNDCGRAWQASRSGVGVDAMAVWTGSYSTLMWRRGDVVVSVSSAAGSRPGDLSKVMGLAGTLDARLAAALEPVCKDVESGVADGSRSPYTNRAGFTGLVVTHRENLDTAQVPAEVLNEPVTAPEIKIPGKSKPVPDLGPLPVRPAPPVSPEALPGKVAFPVLPKAPTPAATAETYTEQVADTDGPGCGWAFTGQVSPAFNAAKAQAAVVKAQASAQKRLVKGWVKWERERRDYYVAYEKYLTQVDRFTVYAQQVEKVRKAWAKIRAERQEYLDALSRYEWAKRARADFLERQQAAREAYDAAVEACAAMPEPTPTPTPTPSSSPSPSPSPSVKPSPAPTRQCPPHRPDILDQDPPSVPQEPTKPKSMSGE